MMKYQQSFYGDYTFLFIFGFSHRYVAEHEEDSSLGNTRNPAPAIQDKPDKTEPERYEKYPGMCTRDSFTP